MRREDWRSIIPGVYPEQISVFMTEVFSEIAPWAYGPGGPENGLRIDSKEFWYTFALILAARYHPKVKPRNAKSRPPDSPEEQLLKDTYLLARVARHLKPGGKGLGNALKKAVVPRATFDRSKKRLPGIWQMLEANPDMAARVCESKAIKSRKVTIK